MEDAFEELPGAEPEFEMLEEEPGPGTPIATMEHVQQSGWDYFTGWLEVRHRGVRGCAGHAPRLTALLIERYAAMISNETGRTPVYKGHMGGRYVVSKHRGLDGSRKCYITVYLRCVVAFARP